ncbi:hypothetical protein F7734_59160 [Scytonema sp. UIC 10036]|uniref:hypothetical protein n=1 Tax=Scytonema sp. UIC 10036 TaxID=2304196 RepID=UPI0012DA0CB8|nr:hypothetical protein [Scytonema sp. UIC 10036]MUH01657.1 hypothetical protein [Scytonema sp. UIC 10036]
MSDYNRLNDLKDILDLLYERLGEFEKELMFSSNKPANFDLKQRIKREILPNIRKYETEYWELYPQETIIISDEEAETQLVRVEQAVVSIEQMPSITYPSELISLVQEIRDKLEKQDKAASAKLKVVLPLIPAIVSYEMDMETEGLMYKAWEEIKRIVRR